MVARKDTSIIEKNREVIQHYLSHKIASQVKMKLVFRDKLKQARKRQEELRKKREDQNELKLIKSDIGGLRAKIEIQRIQVQKKRFPFDSKWQILISGALVFLKFKDIVDENAVKLVAQELTKRKLLCKVSKLRKKSRILDSENKVICATSSVLRTSACSLQTKVHIEATSIVSRLLQAICIQKKRQDIFLEGYEKLPFYLT